MPDRACPVLAIVTILAAAIAGCEASTAHAPDAAGAAPSAEAAPAPTLAKPGGAGDTAQAPHDAGAASGNRKVGGTLEAPGEPAAPEENPLAWVDDITGASVAESAVRQTVYVDASKGADEGPDTRGTRGKPLRTLGAAVRVAENFLKTGQGVRIRLAPGTYREQVAIIASGRDGAPLVIEGAARGKVILSGSDDWSDPERWQPVAGLPGVLGAPWPHDWGDDKVGLPGADGQRLAVDPEVKGDHPPRRARGFARDDGAAVIEWQPPEDFADLGGFRILRGHDGQVREIARLGPTTGRLVDETVRTDKADPQAVYAYAVVALDRAGKDCGSRFAVSMIPGRPDGRRRPTAVGRRREMVFVDGQLMRQVLSTDELKPGTFCVDDGWPDERDDGRLYLALPAGVQRGACTIEVAVRTVHHRSSSLLEAGGENLVLRNLVVQHFAGELRLDAAAEVAGRNILIEDCAFRANNASGLGIGGAEQMTLRRCVIDSNGTSGLWLGADGDVLLDDIEVRGNNWRGDWSGSRGGDRAGLSLGSRGGGVVIRRLRAEDNAGAGVIVTGAKGRILLDDLHLAGNAREGLVISETAGPAIIRRAVLARNGRSGLLLRDTSGGVLESSTLFGNGTSQIEVASPSPPPSPPPTGAGGTAGSQGPAGHVRGWTWRDNAVVSDRPRCPLVRAPADPAFLESLRSDRNLWHAPEATEAFRIGGLGLSLEAWHQVTGQDLGSVFEEPQFRDPAALDFRPGPGSPLARRDAWPTRPPGPSGVGRLAWLRSFRAETVNAPPYPDTAAPGMAWEPVDLRPVANTPLVSRYAWLGQPLPELKPGWQTLHGVPFQVPEGPGGAAAVALPSRHFRPLARAEGAAEEAGASPVATLPVGRTVREVYILHGCARASQYAPAARYELVYADGTAAGIDVVPLGAARENADRGNDHATGGPGAAPAPDAEARLLERRDAANIQNWDADALHFSRGDARLAMIVDPDDPASGIRYLYTLRWPNPHPDLPVRRLRLASADPDQEAAVAVFAVTLHVTRPVEEARASGMDQGAKP